MLTVAVISPAMAAAPVKSTLPITPGEHTKANLYTKPQQIGTGNHIANHTRGHGGNHTMNRTIAHATNTGRLIATATRVRREQFRLTMEQLHEMGYHGSVSDFATGFNAEMSQLKQSIRARMENESNFTTAVVHNLMERRLSRIRERLMANITVNDSKLPDELGNSTNATGKLRQRISKAIKRELPFMSPRFKKRLLLTFRYGTPEEKRELARHMAKFATEKSPAPVVIDAEKIRQRLQNGENIVPIEPVDSQLAI